VPYTYHFFGINLVIFFLLLRGLSEGQGIWVGRAFYIWIAVFNLFITSVFWAFMVDIFGEGQSKRLFGFIAAGGSTGAILGSSITAFLAVPLGPINLLIVSGLILELAVLCVLALGRIQQRGLIGEPEPVRADAARVEPPQAQPESVIGGSIWAGITHLLRSPYLLAISAFILLFTIGSSFLYIQQVDLVGQAFADRAARTAFFAKVDLVTNIITFVGQIYLFSRLMRWLGVGGMLVVFNVARRSGNFAVARPTREVLYTVIPREDKYKAKSFIDTFVYRLGDQVGAWGEAGLRVLGLGVAGVSLVAVPLSALWLLIAIWLGLRYTRASKARLVQAASPAAD